MRKSRSEGEGPSPVRSGPVRSGLTDRFAGFHVRTFLVFSVFFLALPPSLPPLLVTRIRVVEEEEEKTPELSPQNGRLSPSRAPPDVRSVCREEASCLLFQCRSTRGSKVGELLSSGSPRGPSWPLLVVIFLSRHCSLLCSPSFLIILSAIYQTMKSERKKKLNLSFLCIMAYVKFFGGKMFFVCVLSLSVP